MLESMDNVDNRSRRRLVSSTLTSPKIAASKSRLTCKMLHLSRPKDCSVVTLLPLKSGKISFRSR
jgi:hypothetical protein